MKWSKTRRTVFYLNTMEIRMRKIITVKALMENEIEIIEFDDQQKTRKCVRVWSKLVKRLHLTHGSVTRLSLKAFQINLISFSYIYWINSSLEMRWTFEYLNILKSKWQIFCLLVLCFRAFFVGCYLITMYVYCDRTFPVSVTLYLSLCIPWFTLIQKSQWICVVHQRKLVFKAAIFQ